MLAVEGSFAQEKEVAAARWRGVVAEARFEQFLASTVKETTSARAVGWQRAGEIS